VRLDLSLRQKMEQTLRLAPQIIQSIEILQLPSLDLRELIEQELLENEVLEVQDQEREEEGALEDPRPKSEEGERLANEESYESFEEWEEYTPRIRDDGEKDKKLEALQNTPSRPQTLPEQLQEQIQLLEVPARVRPIVDHIVYNIDERGWLQYSLEEVLQALGGDFTPEEAEQALRVVQGLEPRGVGARSARECLLLQLNQRDPDYTLQWELIARHLEDIEGNKIPRIARETGQPIERINEIVDWIRSSLKPHPGETFTSERARPIYPDVVIEQVDGEYEVRLVDDFYPRLAISRRYRELLEREGKDASMKDHLRKQVEKAKWLIESIEQRKVTLLRVAREIVRRQRDFLDHGRRFLRPLKMQEIADVLGIHVSTVSRAIAEKWVQTPYQGILPLKAFFTGGMETSDGGMESRVGVKERIQDLVTGENRSQPLSDEEIVDRLKTEGIPIARRTVTKYRKALKIPSSRQRKVF